MLYPGSVWRAQVPAGAGRGGTRCQAGKGGGVEKIIACPVCSARRISRHVWCS